MKIAVIGATGWLGGAIAREAAARNHHVTRLSSAEVDVTDPASITAAVTGHDAVVVSVRGPDRVVPRAAEALLAARVNRVLFVGGAGSLLTTSGGRRVDQPEFPAGLRPASLEQAEALEIFRDAAGTEVEWTYLSPPPAPLVDGARTGAYRAEASETPIFDGSGGRQFQVDDLAGAAVDALEQRAFIRQRFTLGY